MDPELEAIKQRLDSLHLRELWHAKWPTLAADLTWLVRELERLQDPIALELGEVCSPVDVTHACPPGHTRETRTVPLCPLVEGYEPPAIEMVSDLDRALHGMVTARPVPPAEVWRQLLDEVRERAAHPLHEHHRGGWQ